MNTCPRCKSTEFVVFIEPESFDRKGKSFVLNVEHSECSGCGYEVIFTEQIRRNDALLIEEWLKIDAEQLLL